MFEYKSWGALLVALIEERQQWIDRLSRICDCKGNGTSDHNRLHHPRYHTVLLELDILEKPQITQ